MLIPHVVPSTVRVQTMAVTLNPVNHKMGVAYPRPGAVIGTDFAGTVIESALGDASNFDAWSFAMGKYVFGVISNSNQCSSLNEVFAEYLLTLASSLLRLSPPVIRNGLNL